MGSDTESMEMLKSNWSSRSTREVLVRAIRDCFELYLGATEYLALAMLLYQPKTAEVIKQSKSELFWVYSAESLFDSAALLAFNLFDKDKNIQFKNLTTLQKHIELLPQGNTCKQNWDLDPVFGIKSHVDRVANRRNKSIAHHERGGHNPVEWGDIAIMIEYTRIYLQKFYLTFMDIEYDFHSLYGRAEQLSSDVFDAVGVSSPRDKQLVLEQLSNFILTTNKTILSKSLKF